MKHLLLLIAFGALTMSCGADENTRGLSVVRQAAAPVASEVVPMLNKTEPLPVRARETGTRPRLAPIVREFAPPAPKMTPSLRVFKTTALA